MPKSPRCKSRSTQERADDAPDNFAPGQPNSVKYPQAQYGRQLPTDALTALAPNSRPPAQLRQWDVALHPWLCSAPKTPDTLSVRAQSGFRGAAQASVFRSV